MKKANALTRLGVRPVHPPRAGRGCHSFQPVPGVSPSPVVVQPVRLGGVQPDQQVAGRVLHRPRPADTGTDPADEVDQRPVVDRVGQGRAQPTLVGLEPDSRQAVQRRPEQHHRGAADGRCRPGALVGPRAGRVVGSVQPRHQTGDRGRGPRWRLPDQRAPEVRLRRWSIPNVQGGGVIESRHRIHHIQGASVLRHDGGISSSRPGPSPPDRTVRH